MSQTIPGTPDDDDLPGRVDLPDEILGGDGNDSIQGLGAGAGKVDRMFGEAGDDTIVSSGTGFAFLDGGTGNDSLVAGAEGINSVVGAAGDDTVIGSDSTDYISGDDYDLFGAGPSTASGNDVIDGGNGDDVISGGPGDDTLSPGAAGSGFDQVSGGDGNDVLALEGAPQDYAIDPFTNFLVSIPATGPGSGVRADVQDVEQVAFGVTAQELAAGEVPLTLVDWFAMFEGSANSGVGRPHFSLSDTVQGVRGESQVAISIADLLANDFDPDGDTLTFVALNATAATGINTFLVFTDPGDIANEGYDPAAFPEGLLLAFLDNPLTGPLTFTYRTAMEANGSVETGSTATVTLDPGPPFQAVEDALRGTIGGQDTVLVSVLLGNDIGALTFTGLDGMTPIAGLPDQFELRTFDPTTAAPDGSITVVFDTSDPNSSLIRYAGFDSDFVFTYLVEDALGNDLSADVTVTVDNEKPVAVDQSVIVAPGVPTRIQLGDIVAGAGNLDPDGDPLILAFYSFLDPAFGTLQGFGPVDPSDPNDFGSIEVTLNPGVTGASIQYGIIDEPNLGGAKPDIQNIAFATLNFVTTAPPPPSVAFAAADVGTTPEGTPGVPGAGGGALFFTLARSGDPAAAFTVDLRLSGTADGSDFAGIVGATQQADPALWRVAFAAGQGSATIEVFVQPDDILEPDETVSFTIEAATGATLSATGPLAATGTILDDDNRPPTGITLSDTRVAPYLPVGSEVARIAGFDPDPGDTLTFGFAPGGNPRGFFAIDGDQLELARPLPFTNGALLTVTLRATDLAGAAHDETFVIEVGRDRIGTPAGERIGGRDSDDRLRGLGGDDELLGRNGNDLLEGGEGDDSIAGGAGDDTLHGDAGNDRLMAGGGDDSIAGGGGRDTISAGDGADTVSGGGDAGTAVLRGPPGQQRVVVTEADYIDLRRPGTLLPDGDADLLLYAVGTDGVDLVRGFEAGRDAIRVTLNGDSLAVREVTNGTWIGFAGDPGGVLLLGATGLVLGTDILIG